MRGHRGSAALCQAAEVDFPFVSIRFYFEHKKSAMFCGSGRPSRLTENAETRPAPQSGANIKFDWAVRRIRRDLLKLKFRVSLEIGAARWGKSR
jgi:hypothetical protein